LRRPSIHEVFGLSNLVGLADSLRSAGSEVRPVQMSSLLSVLPAGRADDNPVAELSSERMRNILGDMASRFDWVLLDTPPLGFFSDAHLVARFTDGALFVIAAGATSYQLVQRGIEDLGRDRIVGIVLNRVDGKAFNSPDHYGRYYDPRD
jgi:Mrp family chromosome partitioning ATPase